MVWRFDKAALRDLSESELLEWIFVGKTSVEMLHKHGVTAWQIHGVQ